MPPIRKEPLADTIEVLVLVMCYEIEESLVDEAKVKDNSLPINQLLFTPPPTKAVLPHSWERTFGEPLPIEFPKGTNFMS